MDQPTLKTHAGPRSFELRMDREVIARISTKLVHQQLAADTIAIRYNTQPALLAAATDVLSALDGRVHSNPALSALSKLRVAIKGTGVVGVLPGVILHLTAWELDALRRPALCNALTYIEHESRGHLRPDEIEEGNRWKALAHKLKDL